MKQSMRSQFENQKNILTLEIEPFLLEPTDDVPDLHNKLAVKNWAPDMKHDAETQTKSKHVPENRHQAAGINKLPPISISIRLFYGRKKRGKGSGG